MLFEFTKDMVYLNTVANESCIFGSKPENSLYRHKSKSKAKKTLSQVDTVKQIKH